MKLWGIKPQHLIEKLQFSPKELLGLINILGFIIFIFKHFFPSCWLVPPAYFLTGQGFGFFQVGKASS